MKTKIVSISMTQYPHENHYLSIPLLLLGSKDQYSMINYETEMVEMYNKLIQGTDDASAYMDEVFYKYLDAIDQADVLLITHPPQALHGESVDHNNSFVTWSAYLAGYAFSQGVPAVVYNDDPELALHPMLHRQAHAVLSTVNELMAYDFKELAPISKAKIMLPALVSGGL